MYLKGQKKILTTLFWEIPMYNCLTGPQLFVVAHYTCFCLLSKQGAENQAVQLCCSSSSLLPNSMEVPLPSASSGVEAEASAVTFPYPCPWSPSRPAPLFASWSPWDNVTVSNWINVTNKKFRQQKGNPFSFLNNIFHPSPKVNVISLKFVGLLV